MNYHPLAKTTLALRRQIRECPLPAGKAAEKFNVNINTIYKWRRRSKDDLFDRSHSTGVKSYTLNEQQRVIICELKRFTLFSLDDLLQILKPYIHSLNRDNLYTTLKQEGLNKNSLILPKEELEKPVKSFKEYLQGYIHVDVKYLPKIGGVRKYLFCSIDRRTRLVFTKIYKNKTKESAKDFLDELIRFYPFKVEKILTDNGKEFTDRFIKGKAAEKRYKPSGNHLFDIRCKKEGIKHRLTKPFTPKTNGMVERSNRKIQDNVLNFFKTQSYEELEKAINKYVFEYNFYIRQKALDYKSPIKFIKINLNEQYENFIKQYNQGELYM